MKKIYFIVLILFAIYHNGIAQLNDNNMCSPDFRLKTNANNPYPTTQGFKTNIYDWTKQRSGNGLTPNYFYKVQTPPIGYNTDELDNPYYTNNTASFLSHIAKFQNSNFYPEDGWELIKRSTGFATISPQTAPNGDIDIATTANRSPNIPVDYFILYNRYTGIMRVWGRTKQPVPNFNYVDINIRFINPEDKKFNGLQKNPYYDKDKFFHSDHKVTALLNSYHGVQNTLDMPSDIVRVATTTFNTGADNGNWFYGQFLMAYDPCTCGSLSDLKISFDFIQSSDISLQGYGYSTNAPKALTNLTSSMLQGYTNTDIDALISNSADVTTNNTNGGTSTYSATQGVLNMKADASLQDWLTKTKDEIEKASMRKRDKDAIIGLYNGLGSLLGGISNNRNGVKTPSYFGEFFKGASFLTNLLVEGGADYTLLGTRMQFSGINTLKVDGENSLRYDILANPGSFESNLRSENYGLATTSSKYNNTQWGGYPTYNQVMGVLALKKKPKVDIYNSYSNENDVDFSVFDGQNTGDLETVKYAERKLQVKMQNIPLEYMINPATNYNQDKTKLYGGIRVKYKRLNVKNNVEMMEEYGNDDCEMPSAESIDAQTNILNVKNGNMVGYPKYIAYQNGKKNGSFKTTGWIDTMEYITPMVQINCLPEVLFSIYDRINTRTYAEYGAFMWEHSYSCGVPYETFAKNSDNNSIISVELVLSLDLVSNDIGRDGKNNTSNILHSYPVDLNWISTPYDEYLYPDAPPKDLIINATYLTQPTNITIYATNSITIVGNVSVSNPTVASITFKAPNIYHNNGTLGAGVILEPSNVSWGHICNDNYWQAKTNINCTNANEYKANNVVYKSAFTEISESEKESETYLSISLYPNPTSSKTTLTLSGYENTSVSVMIFDLVGREVYTQLEKDITAREHQAVLNTETLQAGTYIVKVFNGTEEKIAKLVILKN